MRVEYKLRMIGVKPTIIISIIPEDMVIVKRTSNGTYPKDFEDLPHPENILAGRRKEHKEFVVEQRLTVRRESDRFPERAKAIKESADRGDWDSVKALISRGIWETIEPNSQTPYLGFIGAIKSIDTGLVQKREFIGAERSAMWDTLKQVMPKDVIDAERNRMGEITAYAAFDEYRGHFDQLLRQGRSHLAGKALGERLQSAATQEEVTYAQKLAVIYKEKFSQHHQPVDLILAARALAEVESKVYTPDADVRALAAKILKGEVEPLVIYNPAVSEREQEHASKHSHVKKEVVAAVEPIRRPGSEYPAIDIIHALDAVKLSRGLHATTTTSGKLKLGQIAGQIRDAVNIGADLDRRESKEGLTDVQVAEREHLTDGIKARMLEEGVIATLENVAIRSTKP